LEKPVTVFFAALAVSLLVDSVTVFAIVERALGGYLARQDFKIVHPP
jgi:hypothetical protein